MTATKLVAARVLIGIAAAAIYANSARLAYLAFGLFLVATVLDMADGLVAEARGHGKPFGGFLDICADQLIEYLLWGAFISAHLVPLWIPGFIVVRNSFINLLRMAALRQGTAMFGTGSMITSRIGRWLVGARASRGAMVAIKTIGFFALTVADAHRAGPDWITGSASAWRNAGVWALAGLAVVHLVRGVVIVAESRPLLADFLWSTQQALAAGNTGR